MMFFRVLLIALTVLVAPSAAFAQTADPQNLVAQMHKALQEREQEIEALKQTVLALNAEIENQKRAQQDALLRSQTAGEDITKLKELLSQKDETIKWLIDKKESISDFLTQRERENAQLAKNLSGLQAQYDSLKQNLSNEIAAAVDPLKEKITETKRELEAANAQSLLQAEKLARQHAEEITRQAGEQRRLEGLVAQKDKNLEILKSERDGLMAKIGELSASIDGLKKEVQTQAENYNALNASIPGKVEEARGPLLAEVSGLKGDVQAWESKYAAQDNRLSAVTDELKKLSGAFADLQAENAAISRRLDEARQAAARSEADLPQKIAAEKRPLEETVTSLQARKAALESETALQAQANEKLRKESATLAAQMQEVSAKNEKLTGAYDAAMKNHSEEKAALEKESREKLKALESGLSAEVQRLKASLQEMEASQRSQVEGLNREHADKQRRADAEILAAENRAKQLADTISSLNRDLEEKGKKLALLDQDYGKLKQDFAALQQNADAQAAELKNRHLAEINEAQKEISALKTAVSEKDAGLAAAGRQKALLESELESSARTINGLRQELKSALDNLPAKIAAASKPLESRIAEYQSESETFKGRIKELDAQLQASVKIKEQTAAELSGVKKELSAAREQTAQLSAKVKILESDLPAKLEAAKKPFEEKIAALEANGENYKKQIGELSNLNAQAAKEQERLKSGLKDAQAALDLANTKNAALAREIADHTANLPLKIKQAQEEAMARLAVAEESLKKAKSEADSRAAALETDYLVKLEKVTADSREKDGLISSLKSEASGLSARLKEADARQAQFEKTISALRAELDDKNRKTEALQDSITVQVEAARKPLLDELASLKAGHEAMVSRLKADHAAQVNDHEKELAAAKAELKDVSAKSSTMSAENNALNAQVSKQSGIIKEYENTISQLKARQEEEKLAHAKSLDALRQEQATALNVIQKNLDGVKKENLELNSALSNERGAVKKLQAQLQEASTANEGLVKANAQYAAQLKDSDARLPRQIAEAKRPLEEKINELTRQLDSLNAAHSQKDKQLQELSRKHDDQGKDLSRANEELEKSRAAQKQFESQNKAYAAQVSALSAELKDATARLESAGQEAASLKSANAQLQEIYGALKTRLAGEIAAAKGPLQQRIAELETAAGASAGAVDELTRKLSAAGKENGKLVSENSRLAQEADGLKSELAALRAGIKERDKQAGDLTAKIDALSALSKKTTTEKEKLEEANRSLKARLETESAAVAGRIENAKKPLEDKIGSLTSLLDELNAGKAALESEKQGLATQIQKLEENLSSQTGSAESLRAENAKLAQSLQELEGLVKGKTAELDQAREASADLAGSLQKMKEQTAALAVELQEKQSAVEKLGKEKDSLSGAVDSERKEKEGLSGQLAALKQEHEKLRTEFSGSQVQLQQSTREAFEKDKAMAELKAKAGAYAKDLKRLNEDLAASRNDVAEAKALLAEKDSAHQSALQRAKQPLEEKIAGLTRELQETSVLKAELEKADSLKAQELEKLKLQAAALGAEKDGAVAQLAELQKNFEAYQNQEPQRAAALTRPLENKIESMESEILSASKKLEAEKVSFQALTQQNQQLSSLISEYKETIQNLEGEKKRLKSDLTLATESIPAKIEEARLPLQASIKFLEKRLLEAEKAVETAQQGVNEKETQLSASAQKISSLEAEQARLAAELKQASEALARQTAEAEKQSSLLQAKLAEQEKASAGIQGTFKERETGYLSQIEELNRKAAQTDEANQKLIAANQDFEAQRKKFESEMAGQKAEVERLSRGVNETAQASAALKKERDDLSQQLAKLQDGHRQEMAALESRFKDSEALAVKHEKEIAARDKELESLKSSLQDLQSKHTKQLEELNNERAAVIKQKDELARELQKSKTLPAQLKEDHQAEIRALSEKFDTLNAENRAMTKTLDERNGAIAVLEKKINDLNAAISGSDARLGELAGVVAGKDKSIAALNEKIAQSLRDLEALQGEKQAALETVSKLSIDVAAEKSVNEKLLAKLNQESFELQKLSKETVPAKDDQLKAQAAQIADLAAQLEESKAAADRLAGELKAGRETIEKLKKEKQRGAAGVVTGYEQKLSDLDMQLEDARKQAAALQAEVKSALKERDDWAGKFSALEAEHRGSAENSAQLARELENFKAAVLPQAVESAKASLQEKIDALAANLKEETAAKEKYSAEFAGRVKEIEGLMKKAAEHDGRVQGAEKRLEEANKTIEQLKKEQTGKSSETARKYEAEIGALRKQVTDYEAELASQKNLLKEAQDKFLSANKKAVDLDERIKKVRDEIRKEDEAKISELRAAMTALEQANAENDARAKQAAEALQLARSQVDNFQKQLSGVQAAAAKEHAAKINDLESRLAQAVIEAGSRQKESAGFEEKLAGLKAELAKRDSAIADLSAQLKDAKTKVSDKVEVSAGPLKARVDELSRQLQEAQAGYERERKLAQEAMQAAEKLKADFEGQAAAVATLQAALEEQKQKNLTAADELKSRLSQKENELAVGLQQIKAQNDELTKLLTDRDLQAQRYRKEKDEASGALEAANAQLARLKEAQSTEVSRLESGLAALQKERDELALRLEENKESARLSEQKAADLDALNAQIRGQLKELQEAADKNAVKAVDIRKPLEGKIEQLAADVKAKDGLLTEQKKNIDGLNQQLDSIRKELEENKILVLRQATEAGEWENRIAELRKQLEAQRMVSTSKSEAVDDLTKELMTAKAMLQASETTFETKAEGARAPLREQIEAMEEMIKAKDVSLEEAAARQASFDEKLSALEAQMQAVKGENDLLAKARDDMAKELEALKAEKDGMVGGVRKEYEEKVKFLENSMLLSRGQTNDLEIELKKVQSLNQSLQEQADSLKKLFDEQAAKYQAQISQLSERLASHGTDAETKEQALKTWEADYRQLKDDTAARIAQQRAEFEEEIGSLRAALNSKEAELEKLEKEMGLIKTERAALNIDLRDVEQSFAKKLSGSEQKLAEATEALSRQLEEIKRLKDQEGQILARLDKVTSEKEALQQALTVLNEKLTGAQEKPAVAEAKKEPKAPKQKKGKEPAVEQIRTEIKEALDLIESAQ